MTSERARTSLWVRLLVGGSVLGACALALAHAAAPWQDPLLLVLPLGAVGWFGLSSWFLQSSSATQRSYLVLAGDVLLAAAIITLLPANSGSERLSFAAGILVSTLVAAVGRRWAAALAGIAAAVMVCLLGLVLLIHYGAAALDLPLAAARLLVVIAATIEVAWVSLVSEGDAQRRATRELVARELQHRDAESGELLIFTQALAQSEGPKEVAEALLKHLRRHFNVRAHGLVLDAEGELTAVWEERGRLEAEHLGERQERLQHALDEVGSQAVIGRLTTRSLEAQEVPVDSQPVTWVALPIQCGAVVAGVLVLCDPRREAVPAGRVGVLADLARRTGEALARIARARGEETRRTGMLLRQMREGVLLLSPDGAALLANPAARDALDLGSGDAPLPERLGDIPLIELARTPPGVARHFHVQVPRGDKLRPIELSGTAVGILEGRKRVGTLVTLRDVTEAELARRRLVQAEKMNLVGQTLAGVAHELNNPLAALVGYADLLKHASVPEALARPVQQMREQAVRATRIVRNLLNFARRRNPQRVSVQVNELINGTIELFAYEARMNEVTVDLALDAALPVLLADPHALQQVLVNLVQNALHALAQSPRRPRRLTIGSQVLGDAVVVSVADNGPGVPAGLATRIFEPFFTTKSAGHGTGLGLALSRAVAREHGGDLGLETDGREGACFTLKLPVRSAATATLAGPASADGAPTKVPASVLVVDDEASVRESLVAQIGHLGSRVDSACDIQEAQRMLANGGYEAVLLDVRMPGGSGLDLHETLRSRNPGQAQRVVFMTGDIINDDVLEHLRGTGNPFLEKPFTVDELRGALCTAAAAERAQAPGVPPADQVASWFSSSG